MCTEFDDWKSDFEQSENCSYFKRTTNRDEHTRKTEVYFYCNRSGRYETKSIGKRTVKSRGTCKINAHCTSTIKLQYQNDCDYEAVVCKTHYGHTKELGHTWITGKEKQAIAAKRQMGIPVDLVLKDIQCSMGEVLIIPTLFIHSHS